MAQQWKEQSLLLTGATAAASSIAVPVWDWKNLFLSVYTTGSANFTAKVQISRQVAAPDFSAAASPTNQWAYAQIKLSTTNATIDGATGITTAGTDLANEYTVVTDGAAWLGVTITARSAGAITMGVS